MNLNSKKKGQKVRYAVIGLGYISQAAVLPAFAHAKTNSELAALISDDPVKLRKLASKYKVKRLYSYDEYEDCLRSGEIDAIYIALPNNLHRDYAVRAAEAGIHVLCEKPMAVTEEECRQMIESAGKNRIKLMIAYRLHFESASLEAIALIKSGKIGEPRYLYTSFGQQVKAGDIRLDPALGGGSVYDMGIYCLNAARYLFQAEPTEVMGFSANNGERRFRGVDEMTAGLLRFPNERLATFVSSLGSADTSYCRIVGTKGDLVLEPAFDYSIGLKYRLTLNGKTRERKFSKTDQFAAELLYFSKCILKNQTPEPSEKEGLADVRVIQALYRSAESHRTVSLGRFELPQRPHRSQEIKRPPLRKMLELIHAEAPSGK